MRAAQLSEEVRALIRSSVPTLEALELLLLLRHDPVHAWDPATLLDAVNTGRLTEPQVEAFLRHLLEGGLLVQEPDGRFRFHPASPDRAAAVEGLVKAYNEQPVTLVRTVYEIADSRNIQRFADAFRLKSDKEP